MLGTIIQSIRTYMNDELNDTLTLVMLRGD